MCEWQLPDKIQRIVVKVGSRLVVKKCGGLNTEFIESLSHQILNSGVKNVAIVSSGAIAAGMGRMGIKTIPSSIPQKQALAAIGQSHLIRTYEKVFEKYGKKVAQILLTGDDLGIRNRFINAVNTFDRLFSMGVIPIVNENDTVTVEEIKFGDNDSLSAKVALLIDADLLIILTDVDGVYEKDPHRYSSTSIIKCIKGITKKEIEKFRTFQPSKLGTGGIYTKLLAAYEASLSSIPTIIANGKKPDILIRILNGEKDGTIILPRKKRMKSKKLWMALMSRPKGKIIIDEGAVKALLNGKSLLPSGIKKVEGVFSRGDTVVIISDKGEEIGRGVTEYNSNELAMIMGKRSSQIQDILGYIFTDEVIHRDKMVLTYAVT